MALALADRIKESTSVTGTGTATLLGAYVGYQTFSIIGNGNTCYYCISDLIGSNWEVGLGTYATSGNTLTRTTIYASSNSGSAVNFTSGTKDIFVTIPAGKGLWLDASGNATIGTLTLTNALGIASGGTNSTSTPTAGSIAYGTGTAIGVTGVGTSGQVLTSAGTGTPTWTTPASGTVTGVSGTAPVVSSGGTTPAISMAAATTLVPGYLTAADWNTFNGKQPAGTYATGGGTATGSNTGDQTTITGNAGTATSLTGGISGAVPYQSAAGVTAMTAAGAAGAILTTVTLGAAPTWVVPSAGGGGGATITDDIATNTTQYLGMARITTGSWSTAYTSSTKLYFNPSTGTLASTIFQSLSDETQKTDIVEIINAVSTVSKLKGVEFNWISNNNKSSGIIAQQLESILPHLVETNDLGLKSVNYSGIIGYLIEAVKELSERVIELEGK